MISSVIAKLDCDSECSKRAMDQIAMHPAMETGDLVDGRLLPITIEARSNQDTETLTRWILSLDGIAFVDVVYVHFEEDDEKIPSLKKKRTQHQEIESPTERRQNNSDETSVSR